jgi:16S rRNA (guanine1516-N2)-methyltransferase
VTPSLGAGDPGLAREYALPHDPRADLVLERADSRLQLRDTRPGAPGPLFVDFNTADIRRRAAAGRSLPLIRAVGGRSGRGLRVLDATAGLGRDAYLLMRAGFQVTCVERSVVVAALLQDGLARAGVNIPVTVAEAEQVMRTLRPQVVYLDPTFPARGKSALVKKEMQYFQALLGPEDAEGLLMAALACATERVVLKRPIHGPVLGAPSHSLRARTVRYDVYV